ncbi:hypothetical protein STRCR_2244 [Streptococcus criceti HS-6]|uniref:Uncharacterized protein n=1 Tax=Streptococcus criceti HS-6 TaxID=873449 RepID=G5JSX3_STRCG|nr:hypothetical protein STRCR_2244 [Streptococcus criceti HS-6]
MLTAIFMDFSLLKAQRFAKYGSHGCIQMKGPDGKGLS